MKLIKRFYKQKQYHKLIALKMIAYRPSQTLRKVMGLLLHKPRYVSSIYF